MTNETRTIEILTKHGEWVDKVEKADKGYNIVLKPNTKVAELNGGLIVNDPKGLLQTYSKLKKLVRESGVLDGVSPAVKKEVKVKASKKTTQLGEEIEVIIQPETVKEEPKPLEPFEIKRPRRVI